jgi:hypothetical protein
MLFNAVLAFSAGADLISFKYLAASFAPDGSIVCKDSIIELIASKLPPSGVMLLSPAPSIDQ